MEIIITRQGDMVIGEFEPGNGTRYTAIAVPWAAHSDLMMGALGALANGWLVTSGNTARSYLFQKEGALTDRYIQERLGGGPPDYPFFGDLIRQMLQRPS